ncbi:proline racemase family protein [Brevibacterium yomogidense]|uniref:proline racemase family protein n=1 Tax=Brevibacterium yomogidense TaxID=946573 RepID=UPI002FCCDF64
MGGEAVHQRNITVFADGQVNRSPCGSGGATRLATLMAAGQLQEGQELRHGSIVGSEFTARSVGHVRADGHDAIIPEITGMAYATGTSSFTVDSDDPLVPGFVLR